MGGGRNWEEIEGREGGEDLKEELSRSEYRSVA